MVRVSVVVRAFGLAAECRSLEAVRARLKLEGYEAVDLHLSSRALRRDLRQALKTDPARQSHNLAIQ